MPCWYYDKNELKQTPSIINDAIDYETECRYRQEGVRFIVNLGTSLNLIFNNTIATGVIYFHRFYMKHSFKQFPRYITACACLFLAGKVEETPKKCKDIIETSKILLTEQKFSVIFGRDPKDKIMTLEKILLQTIKFDLQVEHPYSYLLKYVKCLKGDKSKLQKKLQMAWNFVNDSLSTTLSLQWEPEIIAVAVMYLAGKLSKFEVVDWDGRQPNHLRWWDMFVEDVTMELLEDICHQVLDTYTLENNTLKEISQPTTPNSSLEPASSTPVSNDSTTTEPPEPRSNNYSEPQQGSIQPSQPLQPAPAPLPAPSAGVQPNFTVYPPSAVYPAPVPVPPALPATTVSIQPSFTAYPPPPTVYQAPPANMSVPPPINPNMVPMHLPQPNYSVPPPAVPPPQYQYAYPTQIYYPPQNPPPNNRPYYPSL